MESEARTPLFTNVRVQNETHYVQLYERTTRARRWLQAALYLPLCGYAAYEIIWYIEWSKYTGQSLASQSSFWIITAVTIALLAFLAYHLFFWPRVRAKRRMREMAEIYGRDGFRDECSFYDDEIVSRMTPDGSETRLKYDVVRKVFETKDLFLYQTKQKWIYSFPKEGFSGIDAEGFREFTVKHCTNAKIVRN